MATVRQIRGIFFNGKVGYSNHILKRMRQRHVSFDDIENVVRFGEVVSGPYGDLGIKYKFEGMDYEGKRLLHLVLAVEIFDDKITGVTVMRVNIDKEE